MDIIMEAHSRTVRPERINAKRVFKTGRIIAKEAKVRANRNSEIDIAPPYADMILPDVQLNPQHVMLKIIPVKKILLL